MSTITAQGAVVSGQGSPFELEDLELDDPRDDEIIVRVVAAGICHTDLSARDQVIPFPLPALLGHEGAGIVERVGRSVRTLVEGDHVVVSFNFCGDCRQCVTGRPVQCDTWVPRNLVGGFRPDGSSPVRRANGQDLHAHFFGQSSFATRVLVDAAAAVRVPPEAPLPMLAPLVCGFQTGAATMLQVLAPQLGDTVAVFGAGGVGLSALMAARLTPATRIVAIDVVPERLQLAASSAPTTPSTPPPTTRWRSCGTSPVAGVRTASWSAPATPRCYAKRSTPWPPTPPWRSSAPLPSAARSPSTCSTRSSKGHASSASTKAVPCRGS